MNTNYPGVFLKDTPPCDSTARTSDPCVPQKGTTEELVLPALIRTRAARVGLIVVALGAVAAAPLAVAGAPPAGAVTIAGANTLSDEVSVDWAGKHHPKRTTDVHLLAWNDFHGNLEPAALTQYGQFAGGAAYLATAVHDQQRQYGARQAPLMAGDNIGARPLVNGLFKEEPASFLVFLLFVVFVSVGFLVFVLGLVV